MATPEQRKQRVIEIFNSIANCNKAGVSASKIKLIAEASSNWGAQRRTCLEYLNDLENTNKIKIEGDDIYTIEYLLNLDRSIEDAIKGNEKGVNDHA